MSDGGKGSGARPIEVPRKVFEDNWNAIFGKKKKSDLQSEAEFEKKEKALRNRADMLRSEEEARQAREDEAEGIS